MKSVSVKITKFKAGDPLLSISRVTVSEEGIDDFTFNLRSLNGPVSYGISFQDFMRLVVSAMQTLLFDGPVFWNGLEKSLK